MAVMKTGISRATYYRWYHEDPEFKTAADTAIYDGSQVIIDLADSKLISKIKEGELKAFFFFLQHRDHRYASKQHIREIRPGPVSQISKKAKDAVDRVFAMFERTAKRAESQYKDVPEDY